MRILCLLISIFALIFGSTSAYASKEGILRMSSFELTSDGIGESGPVTITGKQGDKGILALSITAFGKRFELDVAQLAKVQGLPINGFQLSYEAGYKEQGGRTVYIVLSKGFTSGTAGRKFVVITESGAIRVTDELR
ncbi:hypothetical protein ACXU4B_16405 [Dyella soli]|uniref:Uncharacterized protein n=1 Tax=Dyella soli TaxID=522319 RepID=A0A4R0YQC9_9GAMM|nr:hypothetical protein [Dyella soli]TCI08790.1 hypothetical protein EZM97_21275 [Dyella soli]